MPLKNLILLLEAENKKDIVHSKHWLTVPTSGKRNPAPALARMSLIGRTKPVGTPFLSASWESDRWVLAMQTGRCPKPWGEQREKRKIYWLLCHAFNCPVWLHYKRPNPNHYPNIPVLTLTQPSSGKNCSTFCERIKYCWCLEPTKSLKVSIYDCFGKVMILFPK